MSGPGCQPALLACGLEPTPPRPGGLLVGWGACWLPVLTSGPAAAAAAYTPACPLALLITRLETSISPAAPGTQKQTAPHPAHLAVHPQTSWLHVGFILSQNGTKPQMRS